MDSTSDSGKKEVETLKTATKMVDNFGCPYCTKGSPSPGGTKWHVKSDHPEKFDEFMSTYYPKMEELFKEKQKQRYGT